MAVDPRAELAPAYGKIDHFIAYSNRIDELVYRGLDIVNMCKGEFDGGPPDRVREAISKATRDWPAQYTDISGTPALKSAISAKLIRDNDLHFEPNEILVTCGANQALYNAMRALLSVGDEAILVAPYWPPFVAKLHASGAVVVVVSTDASDNFLLTPEALSRTLSDRSTLLVLNSPCNPTGQAYTMAQLRELGDVILRHPNLSVLCDDVYEATHFKGRPINLLNACPELRSRTVIVSSLSKAYGMSGWRIGYATASPELVARMICVQTLTTFNASSLAQAGAVAALNDCPDHPVAVQRILKKRHDRMLASLRLYSGIKVCEAVGAFYLFPEVSSFYRHFEVDNDLDLAEYLLDTTGLAVVPGSVFGAPGHIRLCFAIGDEKIDRAIAAMAAAFGAAHVRPERERDERRTFSFS